MMKNIAILASGSGTNAENISKYLDGNTEIRVAVILSNRPGAGVHRRAEGLGIPSFTFTGAEFREGSPILRKLAEYEVDFIVLAGFLLKIPADIIQAYPDKIINIHPSLLPAFGGKGMYGDCVHQAVVAAKAIQTGITIHYVNDRYDEGAIIFQQSCPVFPSDTADDVAARVHELEYKYYPGVIEQLLEKGCI
jgi:phosphoribosylglycinamide formyltransferase-1